MLLLSLIVRAYSVLYMSYVCGWVGRVWEYQICILQLHAHVQCMRAYVHRIHLFIGYLFIFPFQRIRYIITLHFENSNFNMDFFIRYILHILYKCIVVTAERRDSGGRGLVGGWRGREATNSARIKSESDTKAPFPLLSRVLGIRPPHPIRELVSHIYEHDRPLMYIPIFTYRHASADSLRESQIASRTTSVQRKRHNMYICIYVYIVSAE